MKKRKQNKRGIRLFLAAAVLLAAVLSAAPEALAAEDRVTDRYGLFTQSEAGELEEACASYTQETGFDAAILTIGASQAGSYEEMIRYMEDYADRYLGENSIGLIINMDIRYYYIDIKGSEALSVYTDDRQVELGDQIVQRLSAGNYAGACEAFLSTAAQQYAYVQATGSYGTLVQEKKSGFRAGILAGSALLAAVIAGIATAVRGKRHRERRLAVNADRYVVPGSVNLYVNRDRFVSQYVTRMPIADEGGPKGGGGGHTTVHTSGGGHMHSGHGGGF